MKTDVSILLDKGLSALVSPVRRMALRLLDLQLWCMGRDVRHAGNLLFRCGFTRRRPPEGVHGGSEYTLRLPREQTLTLWGYGVHLAHPEQGGLFLKRYGFTPRCTPPGFAPAQCWHVQAWKQERAPRTPAETRETAARLAELTAWFATYETWVIRQADLAYRKRTFDQWHKEAVVPAEALASSWTELADHFTQY